MTDLYMGPWPRDPQAPQPAEHEAQLTLEVFSHDLNAYWNRHPYQGIAAVAIPAMGMMGECAEANELLVERASFGTDMATSAGKAGEHFKKHIRDGKPIAGNQELALELGDVLHYWCRLVYLTGYSVEDIMRMNVDKLERRRQMQAAREREFGQ